MSTEHPTGEAASRRITELAPEGDSWGYTAADGAMAGGYRTLGGAAEAAVLHQLGRSRYRDLADAYFEHGTAGEALVRAGRRRRRARPRVVGLVVRRATWRAHPARTAAR